MAIAQTNLNHISKFSTVSECNEALNKDLKDKFASTEYSKLKDFFIEYLKSDSETQRKKKDEIKIGLSSIGQAIVEGIPVKNALTGSYDSANSDEVFIRTAQSYLKEHFLTDEQFNQVLAEKMGDNQLEAYKACLKTKEK